MWLNPYTLIVREDETYTFVFSGLADVLVINTTDEQRVCIDKMVHGETAEYDELKRIFPEDSLQKLIDRKVFSAEEMDTVSMFSRTDAFFRTYGMPQAREKLRTKHVLILGCGGIGTQMAWHMAAVGVGRMTLVDFDEVEESNLNRQIMFGREDVGKPKTQVLREKLSSLNPSMEIHTLQTRVSSEEELERICTAVPYDLVIKSLDSPSEMPLWLDRVCRRCHLTSITGITARENILIGPTFLPGVSEIGFSDLLPPQEGSAQKVSGIAPSLGIMLYNISSELATEAVKVLIGEGTLKYPGIVVSCNLFTNEERFFGKETESVVSHETDADSSSADSRGRTESAVGSGKEMVLGLLLVACLAFAGSFRNWMIFPAFLAALVLPFYLYRDRNRIMMTTFVDATVAAAVSFIVMIHNGALNTYTSNMFEMITAGAAAFVALSAVILAMCMINYAISRKAEFST